VSHDGAAEQQLAIIIRTRELLLERPSPIVQPDVIEAIGTAIAEQARELGDFRSMEDVEWLGRLMHEVRNLLNTASLAYDMQKRNGANDGGRAGAILGRSLQGLHRLVERSLSDVRLAANREQSECIGLAAFLGEIAAAGDLEAASRGVRLSCTWPAADLCVHADPHLLSSAVNNLLSNAFKHTPAGGVVVMHAHHDTSTVWIDIDDECGGLPEGHGDLFRPFGTHQSSDRTGLGLGLSIARRAVRSAGGDIDVRNRPGDGCTFTIRLPRAGADAPRGGADR
jgi:signal transduction histidine kinase